MCVCVCVWENSPLLSLICFTPTSAIELLWVIITFRAPGEMANKTGAERERVCVCVQH